MTIVMDIVITAAATSATAAAAAIAIATLAILTLIAVIPPATATVMKAHRIAAVNQNVTTAVIIVQNQVMIAAHMNQRVTATHTNQEEAEERVQSAPPAMPMNATTALASRSSTADSRLSLRPSNSGSRPSSSSVSTRMPTSANTLKPSRIFARKTTAAAIATVNATAATSQRLSRKLSRKPLREEETTERNLEEEPQEEAQERVTSGE